MQSNKTKLPPIFVVGCARSGTTMVAELLADSPWGEPFETHFITKLLRDLNGDFDLSSRKKFDAVMQKILRERSIVQIMDLDIDLDEFYNSLDQHDLAHVIDELIRKYRTEQGFESWGDKTPHYVQHLEGLHQLFPDAKFIHIVRDGRDVALSLLQKDWGPSNVFACAELWKKSYRNSENTDAMEEKGVLFKMKYEDFLSDPEAVLGQVYEFLEQPIDPIKLRETVSQVRSTNFNKWRTKMTPRQIAVFEGMAATTLTRFGYEVTHEEGSVPPLTVIMLRANARFRQIFHLIKLNLIDGLLIRVGLKEPFGETN